MPLYPATTLQARAWCQRCSWATEHCSVLSPASSHCRMVGWLLPASACLVIALQSKSGSLQLTGTRWVCLLQHRMPSFRLLLLSEHFSEISLWVGPTVSEETSSECHHLCTECPAAFCNRFLSCRSLWLSMQGIDCRADSPMTWVYAHLSHGWGRHSTYTSFCKREGEGTRCWCSLSDSFNNNFAYHDNSLA